MGASVYQAHFWSLIAFIFADGSPGVDVELADKHALPSQVRMAENLGVPVVSSEWVIQCLIMGCRLPHQAHPKFKYDYQDPPPSKP